MEALQTAAQFPSLSPVTFQKLDMDGEENSDCRSGRGQAPTLLIGYLLVLMQMVNWSSLRRLRSRPLIRQETTVMPAEHLRTTEKLSPAQ